MKALLILTILTFSFSAWSERPTSVKEKLSVAETQSKKDSVFKHIADFPIIQDTTKFIADLRQTFKLEVDESSFHQVHEKITTYQKVSIYGSEKKYFFIEYDYGAGCGAAFPWKYQLLLSAEGKLVKILSGMRFEFVEIFKNENPFLLTVVATDKGNGGHEIYKISADTLQNFYVSNDMNSVKTYDAHQDNSIYAPNELTLTINDDNNDGFNDIGFVGELILIQGQTENGDWFDSEIIDGKTITYSIDHPFKKIPLEFVFLYDNETGQFTAKENYTEKYGLDH